VQTADGWTYEPVPTNASHLFRLCWQLESWLRIMVYVELRSARPDWEAPLMRVAKKWPPTTLIRDKSLHHMVTPHRAAISYLSFGELWEVITDCGAWPMFQPYFPPRDNTDARIKEVKAIRNRIAHFREPHPRDVDRLVLFARDMEPGIRRFCSRYTQGLVFSDVSKDPVFTALESDWDHRGYKTELLRGNCGWLYAPHPHRMDPLLHASLDVLAHPECTSHYPVGTVYAITMNAHSQRLDAVQFFDRTRALHNEMIHIILSPDSTRLTVTIPAIHGVEKTTDMVLDVLYAGVACSRGYVPVLLREKLNWPEYVLWPDHLLSFYSDDINEPVLDIT
jgi:hypothetical protein